MKDGYIGDEKLALELKIPCVLEERDRLHVALEGHKVQWIANCTKFEVSKSNMRTITILLQLSC